MTLLLATRNPKKGRELRRLLIGLPIRIMTLDRFPDIPAVKEDAPTFQGNAVKKAVVVSRRTILPVLADDSGLTVHALGGLPGVRSARFAGPGQNDRKNMKKLLHLMKDIPASRRGARFVCVLALAAGGRLIKTFQGTCAGSIGFAMAGRHGFGYDPLFIPRASRKTFAQWGPKAKDAVSHRTRAIRKFKKWFPQGARLKPGTYVL